VAVYKTSNSGLLTRREYTSFLAGNEKFIPNFTTGAYDSIASTTVGAGGASSVTFSSIPSTYTHLQIRAIARGSQADASDQIGLRFNSDSGSNYAIHQMGSSGSSTFSTGGGSETKMVPGYVTGANSAANVFGAAVIDILDYANTNKYKTVKGLTGYDVNGGGLTIMRSGLWMNTAAITNIVCLPDSGVFAQYTSIALYGIKGN
jgi:hypothetical protein